jgi:hypothetical protein
MIEVSSIVSACADLERAQRSEHERKYPVRRRRAFRYVIDEACHQVEQVNLAGGGACPHRVAHLIEYLRLLAGEPGERPSTSLEAHDALFHLAVALLGCSNADERPRRSRAA